MRALRYNAQGQLMVRHNHVLPKISPIIGTRLAQCQLKNYNTGRKIDRRWWPDDSVDPKAKLSHATRRYAQQHNDYTALVDGTLVPNKLRLLVEGTKKAKAKGKNKK